MQGKIQSAELETVRMSGKIEVLEARIGEMTTKGNKMKAEVVYDQNN